MSVNPPSPPKRAIGWWAFGFGVLTLLASFFVPVAPTTPEIMGHGPAKVVVFALAAATLILVGIARANHESRRLYILALGLAAVGVFLEYVVAAAIVGIVVAVILAVLG
jgi:hypothetical protein